MQLIYCPMYKRLSPVFTRHSIREEVPGQGLAGYDLQLTNQGRDLAQEWGAYLADQTDRRDSSLYFKSDSALY